METLQARLDSFKPKRSKASSSKQASVKWPHPSAYKATPRTLAEAGFFYEPAPNDPDNVTCFCCGKSLGGWDEDDDPFEIHYAKCRSSCPWAIVRCRNDLDEHGRFNSADATRLPTNRAMEKARLDTFSKIGTWPYDAVKGHGANSRAMAKAGFVYAPESSGDDTATCLYCNLSLSGWDHDDDPLEEHKKRDVKQSCAFLIHIAESGSALGRSTSKRPPSKAAAKPPARAASKEVISLPGDDSDDDFTPSNHERSSRLSTAKSTKSRASSTTTKTPASRRSTRGTGTNGKTPGSRNTVSSEVEGSEPGSESDAGRKVSRSKGKGKGRSKSKARVSAIAEEEGEGGLSPAPEPEMEPEEAPAPPTEPEKPKRGRPPKAAKAPPKARAKKVVDEPEDEDEDEEAAGEKPELDHPPKKGHTRTRSKANLSSDAEGPASTSAKPSHSRTQSGPKAKVAAPNDSEPTSRSQAPAPKRAKKSAAPPPVEDEDDEDEDVGPPPPRTKAKAKTPTSSRQKPRPPSEPPAPEEEPAPAPVKADGAQHRRTTSGRSTTSKKAPPRQSSGSDDAGYATADADRMEVDVAAEPAPEVVPHPNKATKPSKPSSSRPAASTKPVSKAVERARAASVSSDKSDRSTGPRASSTRPSRLQNGFPPSESGSRESLKVVEIDSDGEEAPAAPKQAKPAPASSMKANGRPLSAQSSTLSIAGPSKPTRKDARKKGQTEAVAPTKLPTPEPSPPALDVDVDMEDENKAPSPRRPEKAKAKAVMREPSPPPTRRSQSPPRTPPADNRSPSPFDDVKMESADVGPSSPRTYHPYLAQYPVEKLTELTEEERHMTLEQYIRREAAAQYRLLQEDGERRIAQFQERAEEAKRLIEAP